MLKDLVTEELEGLQNEFASEKERNLNCIAKLEDQLSRLYKLVLEFGYYNSPNDIPDKFRETDNYLVLFLECSNGEKIWVQHELKNTNNKYNVTIRKEGGKNIIDIYDDRRTLKDVFVCESAEFNIYGYYRGYEDKRTDVKLLGFYIY